VGNALLGSCERVARQGKYSSTFIDYLNR